MQSEQMLSTENIHEQPPVPQQRASKPAASSSSAAKVEIRALPAQYSFINLKPEITVRLVSDFLIDVIKSHDATTGINEKPTRFHARTVPSIDIKSYLARILRYSPLPNEVFLAVLAYIDTFSQITRWRSIPPAFGSIADDASPASTPAPTSSQNQPTRLVSYTCRRSSSKFPDLPIYLSSFNAHRLIITSVLVAMKFYSDVFFTNAHMAKVGGLPVLELNALELEFLVLIDFNIGVPIEELQKYGQLVLEHYLRKRPHITVVPTSPSTSTVTPLLDHMSLQSPQPQQHVPTSQPTIITTSPSTASYSSLQQSSTNAQASVNFNPDFATISNAIISEALRVPSNASVYHPSLDRPIRSASHKISAEFGMPSYHGSLDRSKPPRSSGIHHQLASYTMTPTSLFTPSDPRSLWNTSTTSLPGSAASTLRLSIPMSSSTVASSPSRSVSSLHISSPSSISAASPRTMSMASAGGSATNHFHPYNHAALPRRHTLGHSASGSYGMSRAAPNFFDVTNTPGSNNGSGSAHAGMMNSGVAGVSGTSQTQLIDSNWATFPRMGSTVSNDSATDAQLQDLAAVLHASQNGNANGGLRVNTGLGLMRTTTTTTNNSLLAAPMLASNVAVSPALSSDSSPATATSQQQQHPLFYFQSQQSAPLTTPTETSNASNSLDRSLASQLQQLSFPTTTSMEVSQTKSGSMDLDNDLQQMQQQNEMLQQQNEILQRHQNGFLQQQQNGMLQQQQNELLRQQNELLFLNLKPR